MPQRRFEFCRVCRQNHNQGRGHRYSTKHKQCLELLQGKMLKRIQEIRHFVKNVVVPVTTDGAQDRNNKFWCHFCEQEIIEKEDSASVTSAQAIKHLASLNHADNINTFWIENGGDFDKQRLYVIGASDLATWEEACKVMKPASVRVDGPLSSNSVTDLIQFQEVPDSPKMTQMGSGGAFQTRLLGLSFVQVPSAAEPGKEGIYNVHSGAAPPWMLQRSLWEGEASSSPWLTLSRTQQAKSSKIRNPNRVGAAWAERRRAELEREKKGEEMVSTQGNDVPLWFPNFGRVWQSGPRRDTRKEFEAEKRAELKESRRREGRGLAKRKAASGTFEFKPYISKKHQKGELS